MDALRQETSALKEQAAARERVMREQALALQASWKADLAALRAELELARTRPAASEADEPGTAAPPSPAPEARQAAAPPAPDAEGARPRKSRKRRAEKEPEEATPAPPRDRSDEIRAMMADVASQLQAASEAAGADEALRARLGSAHKRLMDADRAAAKEDWARAEQLANEAAALIADAPTSTANSDS